jgi:hypothetical protein
MGCPSRRHLVRRPTPGPVERVRRAAPSDRHRARDPRAREGRGAEGHRLQAGHDSVGARRRRQSQGPAVDRAK